MNEYRYPGLQPFETKDAALFYGREREARDLYAQVTVEKMVVLFSKSGMGKSSLLNAGLTPLLEKTSLLPLRIRLSNETVALEEQFLQELEKAEWKVHVTLDPALRKTGATLWEQIKAATFTKNGAPAIPFFVLDQFEEVFTLYSPAQRERFLKELADLTNGNPPEAYLTQLRARISAGERLDVPALESSPRCKFIFSIRSDLLHLLNGISPLIPDIMRSRFELLPLDQEQAEEAVTLPAMLRDPERSFVSQPFRYDDAALASILQYLTKDGAEAVESFQLQILCRAIELRAIEKGARSVTPALFGGIAGLGHIIRDFYMAKIGELAADTQLPARQLLEEQLITDNGRRRSVAEDELRAPRALLDQLVEMRLLRKEPRLGTFYYEISHDTLVGPILEKYKERRMEEDTRAEAARLEAEREEALRLREEAEALAREEAVKRRKAEQQRRQARLFAAAALVGLLFAGWQYVEATKAKKEAEGSATEARRVAVIADSLKDVAINSQFATAKALTQATLSDSAARKEALNALLSQRDTKKALADLEITSDEAVTILLAEINRNILRLEYDSTYKKCQTAVDLKAQRPAVEKCIWEIAYFYTEADSAIAANAFLSLLKPTGLNASTQGLQSKMRALLKQQVPSTYRAFLEDRYFPKFLLVNTGSFVREDDSKRVSVNGFKMAETETTFWQYNVFAKETHHYIAPPAWQYSGDNPAVYVNWFDAAFYANWLSDRAGLSQVYKLTPGDREDYFDIIIDDKANGYRLPNEAEWEFAARGGTRSKGYEYSGDSEFSNVAWFYENSNNRTQAVRQKKANELGLYDMSGNVWEWCRDWYGGYDIEQAENPRGPDEGDYRVNRGGGWNDDARFCRAAFRNNSGPEYRNYSIGFRLGLSSQ